MLKSISTKLKSIASRFKPFNTHGKNELAIVVIDLHSGIIVKHDSKRHTYAPTDTFTIPENMNVYKINASSLGTCNNVNERILEDIINASTNMFYFIENTKETRPDVDLSHETIAQLLQNALKSNMANATAQFYRTQIDIRRKRKRELEEDSPTPTTLEELKTEIKDMNDLTDAFHTLGHRYELHHYKARDVVYNKEYSTEKDVITPLVMNIHVITKDTYNTPARTWTVNKDEITLKQLIHLLKSKGLNNLIIVDGSCSNITEEQPNDIYVPLQDRIVRSIRRSYNKKQKPDIQIGFGPKKTRRNRKTRRYSKKKL